MHLKGVQLTYLYTKQESHTNVLIACKGGIGWRPFSGASVPCASEECAVDLSIHQARDTHMY